MNPDAHQPCSRYPLNGQVASLSRYSQDCCYREDEIARKVRQCSTYTRACVMGTSIQHRRVAKNAFCDIKETFSDAWAPHLLASLFALSCCAPLVLAVHNNM